jgi:hypothetical protein
MQRIRSGWSVAVAAGALMLLTSSGASAVLVPGMDLDDFMLGELPYLADDGEAVNPGTNAPGPAQGVTSQPLWLPDLDGNRFIKLDPQDWELTAKVESFNPGTPDLLTPLELQYDFDVKWNGTVPDELCGECDLMMDGEATKLFFVIWDVLWVKLDAEEPFDDPSLVDGFPIDGITGPVSPWMHANNSQLLEDNDGVPLPPDPTFPFLPGLNIEGAIGTKYAALSGETVSFNVEYLLGENPFDTYRGTEFDDHDHIWAATSLFVYRVPEPTTMALLGSSLLGLAAFGHRRRAA